MADDLEDLKRRLVIGHKSDGRSVYEEAAKSQLVSLCVEPSASVSRLARVCGVNADQVSRRLREHGYSGCPRRVNADVAPPAFVPVPVLSAPPTEAAGADDIAVVMDMQARSPNGVSIDLGGLDLGQIGEVIDALGRLRCFASTKV